jgi:nucleoid-associated protein YgaU
MLHKGAIYWAAALGVGVAAAAGVAIWLYRNPLVQGVAPAHLVSAAPIAPDVPPAAPPAPAVLSAPTGAGAASAGPPAQVASKPPEKPPEPSSEEEASRPQFDIVRVEPTGEAVIAGRAAPKAKVAITDSGRIVAEATADETGQFTMLPPAFEPGSHNLGLTASVDGGKAVESSGTVAIEVPRPAGKATSGPKMASASTSPPMNSNAPSVASPPPRPAEAPAQPAKSATHTAAAAPATSALPNVVSKSKAPVAAVPAPASPTAVAKNEAPAPATPAPAPAISASPTAVAKNEAPAPATPAPATSPLPAGAGGEAPAAAASAPAPRVVVAAVAVENGGHLVATGAAPPDTLLRLYLNGSFLADVTTGSDGRWSLTVEHGMKGGAYAIRADEIDRAKGSVIARAEVPFNFPELAAEQAAAAKPPAPVLAAPPAPAAASPRPPAAPSQPEQAAAETPAPSRPEAAAPAPTAEASRSEPASSATPTAAPSAAASAESPASNSASAPAVPANEPSQASAGVVASTDAANAIVHSVDTTKVVRGDNLWNISSHFYGNGLRYKQIYAANASQIRDPWLIYPGQIFVLPRQAPF